MKPLHQIKAGVIGTGFIGPVHIEALKRLGIQVSAVCGSTRSATAVADRFGIPQVFGDYDYKKMIRESGVDVVHITSPNKDHFAQAKAVMAAGLHCVCEKPLAMNTRETSALVKAASTGKSSSGQPIVLAVNYNIRFYPAVLQMRSMVARGDLGDIIHINGSYLQDWLLKPTDYNWRLLPKEGGALRAVADIGTHWMDMTGFILGSPVKQVLADMNTFHKTRSRPVGEVKSFSAISADAKLDSYKVTTEDYANMLLHYASGARANLGVSQVAAGRKNCIRVEIYGTKQSVWWDSENPDLIHMGRRDSANATAFRACAEFTNAAGYTDYPGGHVEGFPDTFKMLYRNVYGRIAGDTTQPDLFATAKDGHHEVELCDAILRSHRQKKWIKV